MGDSWGRGGNSGREVAGEGEVVWGRELVGGGEVAVKTLRIRIYRISRVTL
jgi:hypothetical protein